MWEGRIMAYTELIKNFNRIREYMREFYVYGFKSREDFDKKSTRSYDNERRRIESWLGDYMRFRKTADGKNIFLSIDSRTSKHNPLYKAWKTKSFTDGDITLYFILMDILESSKEALPVNIIAEKIDEYLQRFDTPKVFDESTIRKKLNEYVDEGILNIEKRGKILYYKKSKDLDWNNTDALDFFSEIAPCGVVGSFLLDQSEPHKENFAFKHHYITGALDSEIVCQLFQALHEKRNVVLRTINRGTRKVSENQVLPLQIFFSVQNGRQYLMAYMPRFKRISAVRIDNIESVEFGDVNVRFDELRERLEKMKSHIWGVGTQGRANQRMEHVEFIVRYETGEQHIHQRLEREKRCGIVEKLDDNTSRFAADVYDANELVPWIRTFICRITEIHFSNVILEAQFKNDIENMYKLYGIEGGEQK